MRYIGIPISPQEWERWVVSFDEGLGRPDLFKGKPVDISVLMKHFWELKLLRMVRLWYVVAPFLIINLLRARLSAEILFSLFNDLERRAKGCGREWPFITDEGIEVNIVRGLINISKTLDSLPDKSVVLDFWVDSLRLIRRYLQMYPALPDHLPFS